MRSEKTVHDSGEDHAKDPPDRPDAFSAIRRRLRHAAFGQRACVSSDGGRTWDYKNEILIRDDAANGDLGYPASIQKDDETILAIYYQIDKPGEKTCLMGTFWKLPK
ncbi:MAG TPA: hypothetical protein PL033_19735 [Candidatus Brocadiia bacterium]|nr:hypothetical protein [Candidatus Brocadiia bacterium]